eukprot:TRINITY_DN2407_c0_g2_i1.p1 TRINITY_DN2407_c0_g2~~TRINITY_DN2407_c0_g2_i1.p1  ORF type:complete len:187 (+),score=28.56 TRINITY_DN2407_c0_g2_i1:144-704(+)
MFRFHNSPQSLFVNPPFKFSRRISAETAEWAKLHDPQGIFSQVTGAYEGIRKLQESGVNVCLYRYPMEITKDHHLWGDNPTARCFQNSLGVYRFSFDIAKFNASVAVEEAHSGNSGSGRSGGSDDAGNSRGKHDHDQNYEDEDDDENNNEDKDENKNFGKSQESKKGLPPHFQSISKWNEFLRTTP